MLIEIQNAVQKRQIFKSSSSLLGVSNVSFDYFEYDFAVVKSTRSNYGHVVTHVLTVAHESFFFTNNAGSPTAAQPGEYRFLATNTSIGIVFDASFPVRSIIEVVLYKFIPI